MTSVYPKEENPAAPPAYEQSTYYAQALPVPTFLGMHPTSSMILQPQAPPVGMYSTAATVPPLYAPPTGMYATFATGMPAQGPLDGTPMFITTQVPFYGDMPIQCICPHCHQPIVTRVEMTSGLLSWLICGGLLLCGCWLGCCLIPFCVDSLKNTEHYCPNCAVLLGSQRRM